MTAGKFVEQHDVAAEALWSVAQPLARQIAARNPTSRMVLRSLMVPYTTDGNGVGTARPRTAVVCEKESATRLSPLRNDNVKVRSLMQDDVIKVADKHFVPCLLVECYTSVVRRRILRMINIAG